MSSYGNKVFEQLLPIFQASPCTDYKNDFLVHDRRTLEGVALPKMRFLLMIRPNGTHLVALGVKNVASFVAACLKEYDPSKGEIHHIEVTEDGGKFRKVTPIEAMSMASIKPRIEIRGEQDLGRMGPACYRFVRDKKVIASASVSAKYDRGANRMHVHVDATIPDALDRLSKMHVALLIEDCCTKEAGSLFWNFGQHQVNGMPFEVWRARVTARHELAHAA